MGGIGSMLLRMVAQYDVCFSLFAVGRTQKCAPSSCIMQAVSYFTVAILAVDCLDPNCLAWPLEGRGTLSGYSTVPGRKGTAHGGATSPIWQTTEDMSQVERTVQ